MAAKSSSMLRGVVIGFWVINIVTACMLMIFFLLRTPALDFLLKTPSPIAFSTITNTSMPSATPSSTPTQTRTPTLTPSATLTLTPLPFSEGPFIIGYSVEGRPIKMYRFGTGPVEKLIVAGMHGGSEYNTVQLAEELIAFITGHPAIIPEQVTLFILEDLNPDGEARGHDAKGRANANNVDLNRNWDANWQEEWPRAGCWPPPISSGTGPGSEPETQALTTFILSHNIDSLINYHSAALGIFPGGLPPSDRSLELAELIASVTDYPYPPITNGCLVTGGFTDWADMLGIAAVDVELTDHVHTDYEINLLVLNIFLTWTQ